VEAVGSKAVKLAPSILPCALTSPALLTPLPPRPFARVRKLAFPIEFFGHALIPATTSIRMGGLDRAITVLDILGSVVQAVPIVGDGLKAATEIATKICGNVKVRLYHFFPHIRLNLSAGDEREPRSVRATRRQSGSIAGGRRERDIQGQPRKAEGDGGQRRAAAPVRSR
jgi:hypothetical protein